MNSFKIDWARDSRRVKVLMLKEFLSVAHGLSILSTIKVAYSNMLRQILGYNRQDIASRTCVSNSIDNFDVLLPKNIYGFRNRVYDIGNDLIKSMTNCINIVNGPMWPKWARALYCV